MTVDGQAWRSKTVERCQQRLAQSQSPADRVAMLRSLTRLNDGRFSLADCGVDDLSPDEVSLLSRFGLNLNKQQRSVRLVVASEDLLPAGFVEFERLDIQSRAVFTATAADAALLRYSSHSKYRNAAQKSAIRALLTMPPGAGLMVSMATGSGKSLLFQLYAQFCRTREPGACIAVIVPTVSLALDHERTLRQISGSSQRCALTGDVQGADRENLLDAFRRGEVPILFLSPEFALDGARNALLESAREPNKKHGLQGQLKALFIDEAHIVESWGRSFRPDFQRLPAILKELRQEDPSLRTVLLSATLSKAAKQELRRAYSTTGEWLEIDAGTPRYDFDIVITPYPNAEARERALYRVIDWAPRPLIAYTTRVEDANVLYRRLKDRGYQRIEVFTGETSTSDRRRIVSDWGNDKLDIVVATSAFGMGIDKSDVRSVIHACLPESASRWYQEIGRAARDSHQGLAVCMFTTGRHDDRSEVEDARSQATGSWLTPEIAAKRWAALRRTARQTGWNGTRRQMAFDLSALRDGMRNNADSDLNQSWNRALLNLMQRAGVLETVSVATDGDIPDTEWMIEIEDDRILDPNDSHYWHQIFEVRNSEQRAAAQAFEAFKSTMEHAERQCVLQNAFDAIHGAELHVPFCGRCAWCRNALERPPTSIKVRGLDRVWPIAPPVVKPALGLGFTLINPNDIDYRDGLRGLLLGLAQAGFEQFIVPQELAEQASAILKDSSALYGLLLTNDELLGFPEAALARLPTAVLLADDQLAERILHKARLLLSVYRDANVAVVARPDWQIGGRRLDQALSSTAPYSEDILERISINRRATL